MKTLIAAGGVLAADFLIAYRKELQPELIIAADRGIDVLKDASIVPSVIVGDYDSASEAGEADFLEEYYQLGVEVLEYPAEKNFTDTEAAIVEAIERGSTEIHILGGTGGRLDHFLGTVQNLMLPMKHGVRCVIADECNRLELLRAGRTVRLERAKCFGRYISLIPFGGGAEGVTLTGFRYPLDHASLPMGSSLGISNEMVYDTAEITVESGMLLMVESRDRNDQ